VRPHYLQIILMNMSAPTESDNSHSDSLVDFEIDMPSVANGDAYPQYKNLIIGFVDDGMRGISFTKYFVDKLELQPLADIYINKPHVFKSVHIIDSVIHSLFRLYGHGDILIAQLDTPYDTKLDDIFSEILLAIYSRFHCEALVFLNSAPQDIEDYIPEHMKELFLSKKIMPYQLEELALQQVQRETTEEDQKFIFYSNSEQLRAHIAESLGTRATLLQNGILGSMVGLMFDKARHIADLSVTVMTTKFNPTRIDPEPVINMVDFIRVISAGFELDTTALREESASYLHDMGAKISHKLDAKRHSGGMMYN
jgi:predicted ATP-grasp superfamily ATP-dependent carboligase